MPSSIAADARVAILGFGAEGRSALAWLSRRGGSDVVVAARERPRELRSGVPWYPDDDPAALRGADVVLRSPGIRPGHPLLAEAARRGVPVTTPTNLFVEGVRAAGIPVLGVTGSKGKSTTATLMRLALDEAGVPNVLVGNIGAPALDAYETTLAERRVAVFEMSSYQTHDLALGPATAVITRLFPEHLDWHGSVEAYYASKLNIARSQRPDDLTVWNAADEEIARRVPLGPARHLAYGAGEGVLFEGGVFRRGGVAWFTDVGMKMRGLHNRLNVCAAITAVQPFGVKAEHMERVIASFAGLPHRLEDLGVHGGIRWINDSISTAPEAAVAAIESFGTELATYIGGGSDRGFDFGPLARKLASRGIENVILLPPGAPRMLAAIAAIDEGRARRVYLASALDEAVRIAERVTPSRGTVLFSPASPSYGVFRDFEERGRSFRELVERL